MTTDEQLKSWVDGKPQHNHERGECCPDFSCCQSDLLAPLEVRQKFRDADGPTRDGMLMHFLGAAMSSMGNDKEVYIAGQGPEN